VGYRGGNRSPAGARGASLPTAPSADRQTPPAQDPLQTLPAKPAPAHPAPSQGAPSRSGVPVGAHCSRGLSSANYFLHERSHSCRCYYRHQTPSARPSAPRSRLPPPPDGAARTARCHPRGVLGNVVPRGEGRLRCAARMRSAAFRAAACSERRPRRGCAPGWCRAGTGRRPPTPAPLSPLRRGRAAPPGAPGPPEGAGRCDPALCTPPRPSWICPGRGRRSGPGR